MITVQSQLILQTIIVTMMVLMGYVVAPILFAELTAKLAGDIAGILFEITAYSAILVFIVLAANSCRQKRALAYRWQWLLALIIMVVLLFGIDPWMEQIKQSYPQGISQDSTDWSLFASLHGVYQVGYLMVLFLTLFGIFKDLKTIRNTKS